MASRKPSRLKAPFLKRITLVEPKDRVGEYPFAIDLFRSGFELSITSPITIIAGENGSGKSTLIESIAHHCGFSVRGGSRNQLQPDDADVASISRAMRFGWLPKVADGFFMRAESFFDFSDYLVAMSRDPDATVGAGAFTPYGGRSLHEQSHGEAFLSLFTNRFGLPGIYLLDEPEAALSPLRQLSLLRILRDLTADGASQIIMATHSPILMSCPGAELFYASGGTLERMPYDQTPHFKLYSRFLANPKTYLAELFAEPADGGE